MPEIEVRSNVTISNYVGGVFSSFNSQINISFIPDEMILKSIMWLHDGSHLEINELRSNLISDNSGILTFFSESNILTNLNIVYTLKKPINGTYNFFITDSSGAFHNINGTLVFTLEFIKYKERRIKQN